jgi:hypothetical protein
MIDGQVVGTWKRALQRNGVAITLSPFGRISAAQRRSTEMAAERYAAFLQMPVTTAFADWSTRS